MKDEVLLEQLTRSEIFRDYERSFSEATGLPLALRPVDSRKLAHHGKRCENALCAMFATCPTTCLACIEAQRQTADPTIHQPQSTVCFAGLSEASVPVRTGDRLLGFLQTGEVIVGRPTRRQFNAIVRQLQKRGAKVDPRKLEVAYFHTKALTPKQYQSVLRLLAIFAEHLGLVANQLALRSSQAEPECVTKARQFLQDHQDEEITLSDVANAVHMSTFYFCKVFKRSTGMTFTDYLSRLRIERAKNLLLNPNARIGEVAFESGFQSLTHFNRTFQRLLGESPSEFRAALPR